MDALLQDIQSGIRQLFRQRGSSVVAIVTLALGIGLSTAIFSVVDAAMLRPLPYPDPRIGNIGLNRFAVDDSPTSLDHPGL
jgi:putative ABC transport system permease protein